MVPSLRVHGLDSSVELRFTDPDSRTLLEAATHVWSRCLIPATSSRQAETLHVQPPSDSFDAARRHTLQRLTQDVTESLITSQAGHWLMLHAGAVSNPATGDCLVFAAPGGTGKTTLSRHLGQRFGYVSDETVAIDPASGRIHPYPKPLSLRIPGQAEKSETSPDDLELRHAAAELRVGRIVVLRREPDHVGAPDLAELAPLDAMAALLPETSWIRAFDEPLRTLRRVIAAHGPVLRCTYREASDLSAVAAALIGDPS
ncbi:hypothetical protein [Aestuariimicrobium ganziense]|uniref:hypothetical protein n=1 Tax=Aestuariimicrobium ganziense TaxID=2773677 RepID=UPI0019423100|nr:hypothetical protein [Aestuariimicrobium ganziense]